MSRGSTLRSGAFVAFGLLVIGGLVAVAACDDQVGTYVYRGRKYDPEKQCLEAIRSLDVIDSKTEPALCAPVCLVQTAYDGGRAVYVSSTCPPYPFGFDTTGKDPMCVPALTAADRVGGCLPAPPDGGRDGAPEPVDASLDASDAGTDASQVDASSDSGDAASADAATD